MRHTPTVTQTANHPATQLRLLNARLPKHCAMVYVHNHTHTPSGGAAGATSPTVAPSPSCTGQRWWGRGSCWGRFRVDVFCLAALNNSLP